MNARGIIPLIDLGFLPLGAVVALLAESEFLERLPIDLARAPGGEERSEATPEHVAVTVLVDRVLVDGVLTQPQDLAGLLVGRDVVVRPGAGLDAERLLAVLRELTEAASVQIEHDPLP